MVAIMRIRGMSTVLIAAIISTIVLLSTRSGDVRDNRSLLDNQRSVLGLWDLELLRARQVPPSSAEDRHSMDVNPRPVDGGEDSPSAPFAPAVQPVAEPETGKRPSPSPTAPVDVPPVAQPAAPAAPVETVDTTSASSSGTGISSLAPVAPFAPFAPFPPIGPPVTARSEPAVTPSQADALALATAESRHNRDIS